MPVSNFQRTKVTTLSASFSHLCHVHTVFVTHVCHACSSQVCCMSFFLSLPTLYRSQLACNCLFLQELIKRLVVHTPWTSVLGPAYNLGGKGKWLKYKPANWIKQGVNMQTLKLRIPKMLAVAISSLWHMLETEGSARASQSYHDNSSHSNRATLPRGQHSNPH